MRVQSLGQEDPLEKGMATYSIILAWRIPWTEKPDGLQSMGLQRVGHNYSRPHGLQHARLPYPLLSPGVCSNSNPSSQ